MKNFRFKRVMRIDEDCRMLRIGRFLWERGSRGADGWYSAKLSIALWPKLFRWSKDRFEWDLTVLGIRVHTKRAYGGIIV